ncbi:hypothetical protein EMIHUDRAFT_194479 [Emiliania huxleyi CCMP1516]|uniref:Glycoside hydrolase family 5 domain-containing protein n=2 Tax=Emiliania huxleyi TaxID=2903 RepID=A0A0D3L1L2_EMIH1|nr:hypothetical protein EMIHUDRAFT_194479 [Emiliania huxleyi CCMP1516]EOD41897.1 hypothetical protein EMIHUDRAFT_194479 [Emiliania huxleyi CCMP1516]|eukprot:XP_005794326.1 hypothetical protein EMIHUDRAFT_194479 [Emiliania huxleyi CCMP1516]
MSGPVFLGLNVPWNRFGYDIGGGEWDAGWFDNVFSLASNASANAVRVFLHADARATPSYDNATHQVTGLPGAFLPELLELVVLARSHRLVLQLVLWSFDLCKRSFGADLISNSTLVEGYIARALEPMLAALAGAPGGSDHVVLELINEPEWCVVDSCTTEWCIPLAAMQRFVGLLAAGVHAASPLPVTVGSASLKWSGSDNSSAEGNWWSDRALFDAAAGGKDPPALARLDLVNVHLWEWMVDPVWGYDPCRAPAAYWGAEKPIVVAEMPDSLANRSADGLLGCAVGQGFRGGLFWAVNDPAHPLRDAYQALHLRVAKDNSFESLVAWLHRLPTGNAEPTLPPPHESATARAAAEKTGIQAAFFAVAIALATALMRMRRQNFSLTSRYRRLALVSPIRRAHRTRQWNSEAPMREVNFIF